MSAKFPTVRTRTPFSIHHLTTTRAQADGNQFLIGSISFLRDGSDYWLFEVLKQTTSGWSPVIEHLQRSRDANRKDAIEEFFVDQLDMDGDGIDEILTSSTYYEGERYSIYSCRNGTWSRIFRSTYRGC